MTWKYRQTRLFLGLSLSLSLLAEEIQGREVNVTIDDYFGDPTTGQVILYNPPEAWQTGLDCEPCSAKPRPISNAYNSTWMDGSFFPAGQGPNNVTGQIISASVPFIGTAVYVQVILTGSAASPNGNSDFTFFVDNVTSGVFQRAPNGDKSYQFNQTVFSEKGLSNSLHTLRIDSGHAGQKSLVLLDSIIYTKEVQDSPSSTDQSTNTGPQSSSSPSIGPIIGAVLGGIFAASAIFTLIFFLRRRGRLHQEQRIGLLSNSVAMGAVSSAHGGSRPQTHPASNIDPFIINANTPPNQCSATNSPGLQSGELLNSPPAYSEIEPAVAPYLSRPSNPSAKRTLSRT